MCAILRQLKGLFDIADFTSSHLRDGAKKSLISAVITYCISMKNTGIGLWKVLQVPLGMGFT